MKIKFYFLWLALISIGVFILQNLPGISGFTDAFVLNSKALNDFQVWRFITAIFLHGSLIHLVYNLFALLFFGFIVEKLIGSKKFLILFFASGVLANLIAVNFYDSSLGASGAIYGILGCLAVIRPMMMVWAFGLIMPIFIASIFWIIGDILGIFIPDNVGNIAHLSGIAVGFIFGLFIRFRIKKIKNENSKVEIPESYVNSWENRYMN